MKYSPHIIKNQDFNKSIRGFDREEVKTFLEKLSDEFERIQAENDRLKKDYTELKDQLKDYRKMEKNLQKTLINAQESSNKAIDSAKKQTNLLIKEAEIKASQLIDEAKSEANYIKNSVIKLKEEKDLLIAKLKSIVETQLNIFDLNQSNKQSVDINNSTTEEKKKISNIEIDKILEKLL